jgi:hypothetical protein
LNDIQDKPCSPSDYRSDAGLSPDPELITEGWELRFVADSNRAQEAIAIYKDLGYEVRSEKTLTEGLKEECEGCRSAICEFYMIYTRKK